MRRNIDVFAFTAIAAVITAVAFVICMSAGIRVGLCCLIGCLSIYTTCMCFTIRRYRKIAELSEYLQHLTGGGAALDIRENTEGELSILKNEIYKATVMLTEQAAIQRNDKLELANALSDISHQLKTPLTSLSIMIDLLEDENLPPDKRAEFITSIRGGLTRMEWLVLTLLKLARLDADAVLLKKERTRLSELIKKALAPMLVPMEIKEQTYTVDGEDAEIICDSDWTAEALGNIIKNAVENTPVGGCLSVQYGANPLYTYISVSDNGMGIDKKDLPHLFRRFYRGQNASRDSVGIGLAMSLTIMEKQNGDIEVMNNNGGVFTLKFYHTEYKRDKTVTKAVTGQSL